jgi:hypothetical protein
MSTQLTFFTTAPASSALIGTKIKLDRVTDRCCDNLAVISSGKGMHDASLTCAGCGQHRGWLPAAAITFISETMQHFGSTTESVVLRTIEKEAVMAKDYDNSNRGVLFKNARRSSDRDPDFTGSINIDGRDHWLSGWINTSKAGDKYMSLSAKPKDPDKARDKAAQADDTFGIG